MYLYSVERISLEMCKVIYRTKTFTLCKQVAFQYWYKYSKEYDFAYIFSLSFICPWTHIWHFFKHKLQSLGTQNAFYSCFRDDFFLLIFSCRIFREYILCLIEKIVFCPDRDKRWHEGYCTVLSLNVISQ